MKLRILSLLICLLTARGAMGEPTASAKRFQSGVSGLGYRWNFCWEGDAVRYVAFAEGPRPREMGEAKSGAWVEVTGAGTRKPTATLRLAAKDRRDLFASGDRIYQIAKSGQVTEYDERVTMAELRAFMESHPQQYTAPALLDYVQQLRKAAR